jgi:hypothetical protein
VGSLCDSTLHAMPPVVVLVEKDAIVCEKDSMCGLNVHYRYCQINPPPHAAVVSNRVQDRNAGQRRGIEVAPDGLFTNARLIDKFLQRHASADGGSQPPFDQGFPQCRHWSNVARDNSIAFFGLVE